MSNTDNIDFSAAELARYNRHIIIPGFGAEGQKKLKAARVLVVGAGGLGSPVLLYLAAAGVGTLGIMDFDAVDESNLQRQVLYGIAALGRPKAGAARQRLLDLNPHITVREHPARLTAANALDILKDYDVVADGTDNFPTRYLVNDACVLLDKPNVYASIFQFEGQVSVFHYMDRAGVRGPNYRDLYPAPPPPGAVPDCAVGGVLGVLPGIIGSLQALEVIKVITGVGEPLSGRLLVFDALGAGTRTFRIQPNPDNPLTGNRPTQNGLIDYDIFCGVQADQKQIKEITASELRQWQQEGKDFQLIDVREPEEYRMENIGGELIPLKTLPDHTDKISRNRKVVVHCRSGERSARAVRELEEKAGFGNLYNLKGGLAAYLSQGNRQ